MNTLQIELPDRLAQEIDALVKTGWFSHEAKVVRLALGEFVRRPRLTLLYEAHDLAILMHIGEVSIPPVVELELLQHDPVWNHHRPS